MALALREQFTIRGVPEWSRSWVLERAIRVCPINGVRRECVQGWRIRFKGEIKFSVEQLRKVDVQRANDKPLIIIIIRETYFTYNNADQHE